MSESALHPHAHKVDPRDVMRDIERMQTYEPERLNRSRGQLRRHMYEEAEAVSSTEMETEASLIRSRGTTAILLVLFVSLGTLVFLYYKKVYDPATTTVAVTPAPTPTPTPSPSPSPTPAPAPAPAPVVSSQTKRDLKQALLITMGVVAALTLVAVFLSTESGRASASAAMTFLGVKLITALTIVAFFAVLYVRGKNNAISGNAPGAGTGVDEDQVPVTDQVSVTVVMVCLCAVIYMGVRQRFNAIPALISLGVMVVFAMLVVNWILDYDYQEELALDPNAKPRGSWKVPSVLVTFPLLAMLLAVFSARSGVQVDAIVQEMLAFGSIAFAAEYYLMYYYT